MKKFLIIIAMLFMVPVFADTMPYYIDQIPQGAIGMYQTDKSLVVYSNPESNSPVIKEFKEFSYRADSMPDGVFAVLLNEKQLGFLYVTDIEDDGWVEVIYDKRTGARGWVLTQDRMQFLPWLNFYNLYGRKYGLRILKDAPKDMQVLRSKGDDLAQTISTLNYVKQIKLTAVRGNWALVSVKDLDQVPKTGFLKWRDTTGKIYVFPNMN